ncbi:MAG: hypothetical protein ACI81Q_000023 [Paracoccaceae bacterium]|jgi:hypothetical protein
MLGFNRRFDPENAALGGAVQAGEIGEVNFLLSISREPSPPPMEYVRASGGYFLDGRHPRYRLDVLDSRGTAHTGLCGGQLHG